MQSAKIFSKSITVGRTLLLRAGSNLLLGVFLGGGFIQPASAQEAYAVDVYFGYLNNLPIGTGLPDQLTDVGGFPFEGHNVNADAPQNITLIGEPLNARHDTGVIMFENRGHFSVVIHLDELTVMVQGDCLNGPIFRPWATEAVRRRFGTTVRLDPQTFLVLAETENFNFDTSDCGLGSDQS